MLPKKSFHAASFSSKTMISTDRTKLIRQSIRVTLSSFYHNVPTPDISLFFHEGIARKFPFIPSDGFWKIEWWHHVKMGIVNGT